MHSSTPSTVIYFIHESNSPFLHFILSLTLVAETEEAEHYTSQQR
jgi:hypothetical protein